MSDATCDGCSDPVGPDEIWCRDCKPRIIETDACDEPTVLTTRFADYPNVAFIPSPTLGQQSFTNAWPWLNTDTAGPTWYLAICRVCDITPVPFKDEVERDNWSDAHATATGHNLYETEVGC